LQLIAKIKADPKLTTEKLRVARWIREGHGSRATYFRAAAKLPEKVKVPKLKVKGPPKPPPATPPDDKTKVSKSHDSSERTPRRFGLSVEHERRMGAYGRITVPGGVEMTRLEDGTGRVYPHALQFKAKKKIGSTDVWQFLWLSKMYSVPQSLVTIEEAP
jgi:hypothetical protein